MGPRCSCLCNKENENSYNFYPESAYNQEFNESITPSGVKAHKNSKSLDIGLRNNEMQSKNVNYFHIDSKSPSLPVSNPSKLLNKNDEYSQGSDLNKFNISDFLNKNLSSIIKIQSLGRGYIIRSRFKININKLKNEGQQEKTTKLQEFLNENIINSLDMMKNNPFNPNKCFEDEYLNSLSQIQAIKFKSIVDLASKSNEKSYYTDMYLSKEGLYSGYITLDNKKNGYGVEWLNTGEIYDGNWIDDKFSGYGRFTNKDGIVLEGKLLI